MPVITVGRLIPDDIRMNKDGESRWIKGCVHLHPSCRSLLNQIQQRKLPFTFVTGQVLPRGYAILLGEISTYPIPNTTILWKTLEIQKVISEDSPLLESMDISFSKAVQKIASGDDTFLNEIGSAELKVRKQLTDLLGKRNKFTDTLIDLFGDQAYAELTEDPWKMIHLIPYYSMAQADKIAQKLGIPLDSPKRFRAYFRYLLDQSFASHRNTYMQENEFLAFYWMHFSDTMSLDQYRKLAVTEGAPIIKSNLGYHPEQFYWAERSSYKIVTQSLNVRIPISRVEKQITDRILSETSITLTEEQIHAVTQAFHTPLHIITGGPGTGKTTVLDTILKKLIQLTGVGPDDEHAPFLLAAPTGKAAYRMWEQTGIPAHTLHSAFGIVPGYGCLNLKQVARRLSHIRYLIIDEASMLDTQLFGDVCQVLQRMDHIPFLLLVGDADQLPPVQHGQVFLDLLNYLTKHAPDQVTKLTLVKRQKEGSHIPELAEYIRQGQFPPLSWFQDKPDLFFVPTNMDQLPTYLVDGVLKPKAEELDQLQILTPYRSGDTPDTVHALNTLTEPIFNPKKDTIWDMANGASVTVGNPPRTFRVGDKVINRVNYERNVINGSIGTITAMHTSSRDLFSWTMDVTFPDVTRTYVYEEFKSLELGYAITIHASQGSEYENVALCILRGGNPGFLNRNLLYVGITRASKQLLMMGNWNVFAQMAATPMKSRRTALAGWLNQK